MFDQDLLIFLSCMIIMFLVGFSLGFTITDDRESLRKELISIGCGEYDRKTGEFILIGNQSETPK